MKKRIAIITLLLFSLITLIGCSTKEEKASDKGQEKAQTTNASSSGLFPIRIQTQVGFNEFDIADELGYFKEEGLELKYIGVLKPGQDIPSVLSDDNDVFTGHPNTVAKAILAGAKIKIISPGMVDHPEYKHMVYITKDGNGIKGPKDLVGKKIALSGLNSCTDLIFLEWLSQNGVSKDKIQFITIPDKEQIQAIKQGRVDVGIFHPPWAKHALNSGGLVEIGNSYDVVKGPAGGSSIRGVSLKFLEEHPEQVKGFIRALIKAHKWINANHEEAAKIIAKRLSIDVKDVNSFHYDENDIIKPEYIQKWFDLMIKNGQIKEGELKPEDIYTNEYNPYYTK